jgi:hypothetical protein
MPHQYKVKSFVCHGLLDHQLVAGRLDHAQQGRIAFRVRADFAQFMFGEGIAFTAVTHTLDCLRERTAERGGAVPVVLHQVVSHALRGFRPDAGKTPQRFGEEFQAGERFHCEPRRRPE